ncbi:MAG: zinc dependent phospholipase C family protein [Pseudomonadota bacterium]
MPQSLVHLSAIVELGGDSRLPPQVREALQRCPELARLGAILPDLPFFSNIRRRALRQLLHLPQPGAAWATRMHQEPALELGVALLQPRSQSRLGPLSRLALAAGFFSHAALDTALHPLVYRLIAQEGVQGQQASQTLHLSIEKLHSLILHRERWAEARRELPVAELCDLRTEGQRPGTGLHIAESLRDMHGKAPLPADIVDWVEGFARYGRLVQQHPEWAEGGPVEIDRDRPRWFDGPQVELLLERALSRALRWFSLLDQAFAPGDVLPADLLRLASGFRRVSLDFTEDPFVEEERASPGVD